MRRTFPALLLAIAACHAGDEIDPTLTVTSPERGTLAEASTVTVTGEVGDDAGAVRVTVNGLAAEVGADGRFALTFAVPPGIELLETIAEDEAGNQARDVRAILTGTLVPTDGTVADAFATRIGPDAFAVMAGVVATTLEGLDLAALIGGDGPLISAGGSCVGIEVHLLDVAMGDVAMAMAPAAGAIDTSVTVTDLEIKLRADYRVSCNTEHAAAITVRAALVSADGDLGLAVSDGELASSLAGLELRLAGLDLESDGLTGEIFDLVEGALEDLAPRVMEAVMTDAMPGLVDGLLADLTAREWKVPVLERDVAIEVVPGAVEIDPTGALIAIGAGLHVEGDADGRYLSTPEPAAVALGGATRGVALAISDDTANQIFAGMWASGALSHDLHLEAGDPLGLLIGADTRRVTVSPSLPPTVAMAPGGDLRVTIGDLIVRCEDEAGAEMTTIAVSLSTTLGAEVGSTGAVALHLGEPEVLAQVLSQSDRLEQPITGENIEVLVDALYDVLSSEANHVLSALPIPTVGGVEMVDPAVETRGGFVVVRTSVLASGDPTP